MLQPTLIINYSFYATILYARALNIALPRRYPSYTTNILKRTISGIFQLLYVNYAKLLNKYSPHTYKVTKKKVWATSYLNYRKSKTACIKVVEYFNKFKLNILRELLVELCAQDVFSSKYNKD